MKSLFSPHLMVVLALAGALGARPASADLNDRTCDLAPAMGFSDACVLGERFGSDTVIALHYGSLFTRALVIEVARVKPTPAQLAELANELVVELQVTTPDFSEKFRALQPVIVGDQIVYELADRNESSFYISEVRVSVADPAAGSVRSAVRAILGPRAVALISAESR